VSQQGCTACAVAWSLPCTYLAHHERESVVITVITVIIAMQDQTAHSF